MTLRCDALVQLVKNKIKKCRRNFSLQISRNQNYAGLIQSEPLKGADRLPIGRSAMSECFGGANVATLSLNMATFFFVPKCRVTNVAFFSPLNK